jgi:excinuclease ABC subunit C
MGKCLGPCVGAVDAAGYRAAVDRALATLEGRDDSLLAELTDQRDALAEALRFEDAAWLRDRIQALEHVVAVQSRLRSVATRNLAILAPSVQAGARELFCIRRGELVGQTRLTRLTRVGTIARVLSTTFADYEGSPAERRPIAREKVDEMHLLDTWLQRNDDRLTVFHVDPAEPAASAQAILTAVRAPVSAPPQTGARANARAS